MKSIFNRSVGLVIAAVTMLAIPAQATLAIRVTDADGTQNASTAAASLAFNTNDSIFDIILSIGTSNSPLGPATLTLDATVRTANPIDPLHPLPQDITIMVSSDGFLSPTGPGTFLHQNVNTNEPTPGGASGNADFQGFEKTAGALFDTTGLSTTSVNLNFADLTGHSDSGTTIFVSPYTLTEKITMHFTGAGQAQATANLTVQSVPEPTSILLLGTMLVGAARLVRRRSSKA